MLFKFNTYAYIHLGFEQLYKEFVRTFWKKQAPHYYNIVVFYTVDENAVPIKNQDDWDVYRKCTYKLGYDINVVFIKTASGCFNDIIKQAAAFHEDKKCHGCGIHPIVGDLFTCLQCQNVHFCECCIEDNLHPEHTLLVVPRKPTSDDNTSEAAGTEETILCDGCDAKISEFCFRCILCSSKNFCQKCFSDKEDIECREHGMIRISKW